MTVENMEGCSTLKFRPVVRLSLVIMLTVLSSGVPCPVRADEVSAATVPSGQVPATGPAADERKTLRRAENVVLITMDGLRWQELFAGADETLMNREAGSVRDVAALKQAYWRDSAVERRELLMPFFWTQIAPKGVVFGNPEEDSKAVVTNGLYFSYPGYSEILCGFADPGIDSNDKKNNPNVTVLEWLNRQPLFQDSVAAFCSWDVFPYIINRDRSGLPVNAGWESLADAVPVTGDSSAERRAARQRLEQLDRFAAQMPHVWHNVRYDYLTFRGMEEYVRLNKPRVLYLSLGETDDWAHEGRYDLYLDAARRNDDYIRQLWTLLQSMPQYRNCTTLILTTDHGRGDDRVSWKSHGRDIGDCEYIWMAVLGPDVNTRTEKPAQVTQSQIAATVAAAVGQDFGADHPQAAPPLPVFRMANPE
ncbi:MAG: alkaline phosphatase family protein [Fuerstiella sp.]